MASGFQQDINQLSPDFYRVVITMSGGTATWTAASPANGAVNPYNWDSYTTLPSSDANGQRLSRGNMRWQAILEELTKHSDAQILDVEVTSPGATDANSIPTAIAFTVKYDRDDFVLGSVQKIATTFAPTTGAAVTIDNTSKAIRYLVGQGVQRGGTAGYSRTYNTYSFTNSNGYQPSITVNRPDTDGDVYDDISIAAINGTEL